MAPMTLPLLRYPHGLRAVEVRLGEETLPFLFDTGAGITTVDTGLAQRHGLSPAGRLTGYRMTGERVDLGQCADVTLGLGEHRIHHDVMGILDLMALLPPDFPEIGGVLALNSFLARPVTFDFREERLTFESDDGLDARTAGMSQLEIRVGRPLQGLAVEVYVAVRNDDRTVWLELDTANTGPVLLDPRAAALLDLGSPREEGTHRILRDVALEAVEGEPWVTDVVVRDLIIDGNLGATFCADRAFMLDLPSARLRIDRRTR
jgi:hypothetical protein